MAIPKNNYIGLLQEKCQMAHSDLPDYEDVSTENCFKYSCKLRDWVCHGTGNTKKIAKQNAAKEMLETIEDGNLVTDSVEKSFHGQQESCVSKLNVFCSKEKIAYPLFSELPKEDDIFRCTCTVKDFTATGKGNSKKEAKEKAAFEVASHFDVLKYYDNLMKLKERRQMNMSPLQELVIVCQKMSLAPPTYEEELVKEKNIVKYKITCFVGDLKVESDLSHSKKSAKYEAATLLLQTLKNTPVSSPALEKVENPRKRKISSESSDSDEPLMKPLKVNFA